MSNDLETAQRSRDTPDPISSAVTVNDSDALPVPIPASSDTPERWSRLPRPRGRQPRDPLGQSVRFQCREIDDMENQLRGYLQAPTIPAEHATIEFAFPGSSAFMVYAADLKSSKPSPSANDKKQPLYNKLNRTAISIINALAPSDDSKDQMRKQKAIAKVCVEACEKADGFRYSFHNNWLSREDEACRFSYFCNDSTLNKGRAANEAAGMSGKRMRKPVYNCQGLIAIKFSSTKQSLEVHYKHVPLHKTYAERAPPPRRDSKRRKLMELFEPESLPTGRSKRKAAAIGDSPTTQFPTRPTTQPVSDKAGNSSRQMPQESTLHPLVDISESTTTGRTGQNIQRLEYTTTHSQNRALPAAQSPSIPTLSGAAKPSATKPKRAPIPGTMSFSMHSKGTNSVRSTNNRETPPHNDNTSSNNLLPGITDAAAAAGTTSPTQGSTTNFPLSELVALKKKLEEAEERIKKLESDKMAAPPLTHPPPIPQHMLWPPPPGYPPPPHTYPPYQDAGYLYRSHPPHQQPPPPAPAAPGPSSTPVATAAVVDEGVESPVPSAPRSMSSGQNRFRLPPQRPFASVPNRSGDPPARSSSNSTTNTPPHAPSPTPSTATPKPREKRQMGRRFVPYNPGSKVKHAPIQSQPASVGDAERPTDPASATVSGPQSDVEN